MHLYSSSLLNGAIITIQRDIDKLQSWFCENWVRQRGLDLLKWRKKRTLKKREKNLESSNVFWLNFSHFILMTCFNGRDISLFHSLDRFTHLLWKYTLKLIPYVEVLMLIDMQIKCRYAERLFFRVCQCIPIQNASIKHHCPL